MDQAKRAMLERYGAAVLGIAFLVVFLTGPAKTLRLFGSAPASTPALPVKKPQSLTEMMAQHRGMESPVIERSSDNGQAKAASATSLRGAPVYTAHNLRNPLMSLLPKPPETPSQAAAPMPYATATQPAMPMHAAPPHLTIQGVIWGGAQPQAIVDRRVYTLGDSLAPSGKIVAIDVSSLTLEFDGAFWRYRAGSSAPEAVASPVVERAAESEGR